jgi:sterol desaturase/sphingolipid hydroxylase (fatty acid hydroxylase superfamily)
MKSISNSQIITFVSTTMRALFSTIWNFDFAKADYKWVKPWVMLGVVFLFAFGWFDVTMDTGSALYHQLMQRVAKGDNPFATLITQDTFVQLSYAVLFILGFYITVFSVWSYIASQREYSKEKFSRIFIAHLLSNAVAMLVTLLFFSLLGLIAWAMGFTFEEGKQLISQGYTRLSEWMKLYIPTITLLPYPVALLLGVVMGALPGYFSHWLAHKSRFVWLMNHRCHHTAEIMHPAGVGAFMFLPELFSNIPTALLSAAITKLFYYEPLLFETIFLAVFYVLTEKFNHSTVFYDIAYRFRPLRWLSAYYGNGVYHYMHHTAIPGDEIVNVGGSPFLVWDRVFGTYRTPTAQKPPVGLTNQPTIKLNPFAIVLSGWQQIAYELWQNSSWRVRLKIIFGDIYYIPPVSKDFLKQ